MSGIRAAGSLLHDKTWQELGRAWAKARGYADAEQAEDAEIARLIVVDVNRAVTSANLEWPWDGEDYPALMGMEEARQDTGKVVRQLVDCIRAASKRDFIPTVLRLAAVRLAKALFDLPQSATSFDLYSVCIESDSFFRAVERLEGAQAA